MAAIGVAGATSMRELDQVDKDAPPVYMHTNPLRELRPLQKTHHSWGIDNYYLNNSSTSFLDGLMYDYVRVTGSCSIALQDAKPRIVQTCIAICTAVASEREKAGVPPPVIAINFSPWYVNFPGNDPTVTGDAEKKEMAYYNDLLAAMKKMLGPDNLHLLGAVLIDEEKFAGVGTEAHCAATTRKADLIYNATEAVFPDARYEMYNRGAVTASDRYTHYTLDRENANVTDEWSRVFRYTLDERGDSFTVSLYRLPEVYGALAILHTTNALMVAHVDWRVCVSGGTCVELCSILLPWQNSTTTLVPDNKRCRSTRGFLLAQDIIAQQTEQARISTSLVMSTT
jgi:hypothetical protein